MKWLKDYAHLIVGALLLCAFCTVFTYAVLEGRSVMVTQERIDDSYRIHR